MASTMMCSNVPETSTRSVMGLRTANARTREGQPRRKSPNLVYPSRLSFARSRFRGCISLVASGALQAVGAHSDLVAAGHDDAVGVGGGHAVGVRRWPRGGHVRPRLPRVGGVPRAGRVARGARLVRL